MKRLNIKDAFVGEPSGADDGSDEPGDEAVVLSVRGGELTLFVPAGTRDAQVLDQPAAIRGQLRLENERVLSIEISDGATGAFFEDESLEFHRRRQASGSVGLSSIEGPDYLESGRRRACDIMSGELICTSPQTAVAELTRLLAFHNISGLPVIADGQLVGIVSEADVIGKQGQTVAEIMTPNVITCREDDSVEAVAQLMAQHRIKRVLVTHGDHPVGLVSRADIVRALSGT
jgi:CBS domain-containing protein